MANSMGIIPADLDGLPGSPFTQAEVDAAVARVQRAAGWHIAPEVTETVELDVSRSDHWLRLPTAHLVAVNSVADADTATVIEASKYRVSRALAQVRRCGYWPSGYERVAVEMTHGYADVPADLLQIIASAGTMIRRDPSLQGVRIDDFSEQYRSASSTTTALQDMLGDYALDNFALYGFGIA